MLYAAKPPNPILFINNNIKFDFENQQNQI